MKRQTKLIVLSLLVIVAVAAYLLFVHYVPFDLLSYSVWVGIFTSFFGVVCLARPLPILGVKGRGRAFIVMAAGTLLAVAAILWPASVKQATAPHQRLDDFLHQYQQGEYHEGYVRAPRERILDAVRQVSFADMPAAVVLMRLRALAGGELSAPPLDASPILDMMAQPGSGFLSLDVSDPAELVYGMVGRPWKDEPPPPVSTPEQFVAFDKPGHIKVAFNIRVTDEGDGRFRVSTETRIMGNDTQAGRIFSRYWRLIYPGSAIIRRVWLDAIISRAAQPTG